MLCGRYRALCDAYLRSKPTSLLDVFPLLLQLWPFECFLMGRPWVEGKVYNGDMYGGDDVDRLTMGSHWCRWAPQWGVSRCVACMSTSWRPSTRSRMTRCGGSRTCRRR